MSLIESNVRGDGRPLRDADRSVQEANRGDPVSVSVVVSAGEEGSYALSAAELATIESERTKEKLRTKADHVSLSILRLPCTWIVCILQLGIRVSNCFSPQARWFLEQKLQA